MSRGSLEIDPEETDCHIPETSLSLIPDVLSIPYPFRRSLEAGFMGAATEPILLIMEGAMLPSSLLVKICMDVVVK